MILVLLQGLLEQAVHLAIAHHLGLGACFESLRFCYQPRIRCADDFDPVNPQRELRADAVALFALGKDSVREIFGLIAALFLEEKAVAFHGRKLQWNLQHLRLFHRAGDVMTAGHRTHAGVVLRTKLHKGPRCGCVAGRRDAHAHDVVSRRPVTGDAEGLVGIHKHVLDGEEGAGLGGRMIQVGLLIRDTVNPVPAALFIGIDLIDEVKVLWRRRALDALPL